MNTPFGWNELKLINKLDSIVKKYGDVYMDSELIAKLSLELGKRVAGVLEENVKALVIVMGVVGGLISRINDFTNNDILTGTLYIGAVGRHFSELDYRESVSRFRRISVMIPNSLIILNEKDRKIIDKIGSTVYSYLKTVDNPFVSILVCETFIASLLTHFLTQEPEKLNPADLAEAMIHSYMTLMTMKFGYETFGNMFRTMIDTLIEYSYIKSGRVL